MSSSPRDVVEQVRRMVAGDGVTFADLFAEDGLLEYPFALPGQPRQLFGQVAIRDYFGAASRSGQLFDMDSVDALVRETDDPEVVVAEIEHHGRSRITGEAYRFRALGVIRVRDGKIVSYQDYMDPIGPGCSAGQRTLPPPSRPRRRDVRDGKIVSYQDYMDPIATARLLGDSGPDDHVVGTSGPTHPASAGE